MGVPLSVFTEMARLTGITLFTGTHDVVNDSAKTNYATQGYLNRGQPMSAIIQGGLQIVDDIFLAATRKARSYKPNQRQTYSNPQTGIQWQCPWRFYMTDITWTDEEVELNQGASREARSQQYKDLWFKKQMNTYSDWADFVEEQLWAVPDTTQMEAQGGEMMFSIPALINEYASGLPTSIHPGGAWTTKLGINPTTAGQTRWDNQRFTYDNLSVGTSLTTSSLITVFKRAFTKLSFRPPVVNSQYFESVTARPVGFVACSELGVSLIWRQYMSSQNRWSDQMDPYGAPMFQGTPFVHIGQLDGATLFPTGAGGILSTEDNTAVANNGRGPRYWLIQPEYLKMFYHARRTFSSLGVMTDLEQPTSHTMPIVSWMNLFPRSLFRQGHIAPLAGTQIAF